MTASNQKPLVVEEMATLPSFASYYTALEHIMPGRVAAYRGHHSPEDLSADNAWCVTVPFEGESWSFHLTPGAKGDPRNWREPSAQRMLHAVAQQIDRPVPMFNWPAPVRTAWSLLIGHPCRPMSVSEVAEVLGLSAGYLGERFEQVIGTSFRGILRAERTAVACRLLEESELRISEIAARLGGQSLSQFNRNFAATTGVSPSTWRRHHYDRQNFAERSTIPASPDAPFQSN